MKPGGTVRPMRKLLVTCQCGQQMQVPRSAIGKMGMCPTCGQSTRISTANTRPLPNHGRGPSVHTKQSRSGWSGEYAEPPEDAKQRFGKAVDHYYAGRYAESLAVFDSLAKEFPDNPDIEHGREQCLKAMKRPVLAAPDPMESRGPRVIQEGALDEETIRRIVLDKLLNGSSDEVQLKAAEIACQYLKLDEAKARPDATAETDAESEVKSDSGESAASSNGHSDDGDAGEDERRNAGDDIEIFPSREASG